LKGRNPIVAFAGGSGITPVLSIVKTALVTTAREIALVYANRGPAASSSPPRSNASARAPAAASRCIITLTRDR
jgi:ferredoxin-NADP reductase